MAQRLYGLDALRGIAAICVVIFHLKGLDPAAPAFGKAYLAVDFFFMLSGYVMARSYSLPRSGFFVLRIKRLWPTACVGGIIGLPLLYLEQPENFLEISLLNLILLPAFASSTQLFALNGPTWSLFFELIANLLHGTGGRRLAVPICVACGAALPLAAFQTGHLNIGSDPQHFIGGFFRVGFAYFLGVILYNSWRDSPPVTIPPLVTALFMPAFFFLSEASSASWLWDIIFISACPILLAGGLKWRAGGWARTAGDISFPLYAVHVPVMGLFILLGGSWALAPLPAIAVAALLVMCRRSFVSRRNIDPEVAHAG